VDRFPHSGELDVEGGTFAWCGADIDFSSMLFDYTVADGEAKAGAAAARFGGKKRIENTMNVLARDASPGIGNLDLDAAIVSGGAHFQHAACGHSVTGVQEKIQESLLKFIGRAPHARQGLPHLLHHGD